MKGEESKLVWKAYCNLVGLVIISVHQPDLYEVAGSKFLVKSDGQGPHQCILSKPLQGDKVISIRSGGGGGGVLVNCKIS